MATSDELVPAGRGKSGGDIDVEQAPVERLHTNALGLPAILFLCMAAIAPAASMLFNVPVMASQAGAATPLVFVLSAVGVLLLGVPWYISPATCPRLVASTPGCGMAWAAAPPFRSAG
jgi:hypothetical protein